MNSNVGKTIASNRYSSSSSSSCRVENIQRELFRRRPKPCSSWEESWARGSTAIDAQFRLSPLLTPVRQAVGSVTCGGGGCSPPSQNAPHYFLAAFSCFLFLATSVLAQNKDGEPVSGGVTEGDVIRYAIPKPEPLVSELEAFRDAVLGLRENVVTLREGRLALEVAEACLQSASSGLTVDLLVAPR